MIRRVANLLWKQSYRYFSIDSIPKRQIIGFISNLTDRRVFSLTGKDVKKMLDTLLINETEQFFTDKDTRSMNCIILDNQSPEILHDFFLYRPFLETIPEMGDEYWIDVHTSSAPSLIHYMMKFSDKHSFHNIHAEDIGNVIKVQSALSPYGMTEGDEGKVFNSLQATAPTFPAEDDPTVTFN